MRRIAFLMMLMLTGSLFAQTAGENIDVTHYELNLWSFNFSDHTLQGEAFIDFTTTAEVSTLVLELKTLTVTDVASDMYEVSSFNQSGDFLTVTFDEPIPANTASTLDVRYGGHTFNESWGGVEWWGSGYVYNLGAGLNAIPHNLGKTWFPCVDSFTDKASYSLNFTVDNSMKAICSGNLINVFDNGDGTSTWYWDVPQESATYAIAFAIGDYVKWEDVYHGIEHDIPVEVYVKPYMLDDVPGTFANVKTIAAWYEQWIGPYPFNRIGYIATSKGCMEHIDNIAMAYDIIDGTTMGEEYVAHELSHMYFGNLVTCATAEDMWLNEGFASFWGLFYLVPVYGEALYDSELDHLINTIVGWCTGENNWIPLNNIPQDMTYDSKAVYERGAVIVATMMNYMGKENFFTGLRHYLDIYGYGSASSEQLRDALTEATGIDMNGFFDTYVFTAGMPHYSVGISGINHDGDQYNTRVKMTYKHFGPSHVGHDNRVEVTFIGHAGQMQTEMVHWDGLEGEDVVTLAFEPEAAFADYYNRALDAKYASYGMFTEPGNLNVERMQTKIHSVTDSTMLRAEIHLVSPDDDPDILGLNLSTTHYWSVYRHDFGEASVEGIFSFSSSYDSDIIQTQNDSAVLLYRANVNDPWHTIPYTQDGSWKLGRFHVNELMTGEYTLAAIEKDVYAVSDDVEKAQRLFPNPASNQVTLQWEGTCDGSIKVYNQQMQTLKVIPYTNANEKTFDLEGLKPGVYYIENNRIVHKLIIQ